MYGGSPSGDGVFLAGLGAFFIWAGWQGRARYRRLALYDPANPRNIRLDDYENSWTQSFLLGVGALVGIGGVAMTISTVIT
jgi:hypothetical protein